VLFILIIPFKWLDEIQNQKKIKQLALETKEDVVADFNFSILHLIFKPSWEIILGILCLVYFIWILKIEYWTVYFHLAIPWLMYITAKSTRYQTRPYLKDNYKWVFAFNMVNFLLVILLLTLDLSKDFTDFEWFVSVPGVILTFLLIAKTTWYVAKYPEFKESVTSGMAEQKSSIMGKFTLFFIIFSIFFAGIGFISEKKNTHRTEVGEVLEKYIIGISEHKIDTLAVFNSSKIFFMDSSLFTHLIPGHGIDKALVEKIKKSAYPKISYGMSLDLTVTKKRQEYATDCLQIFNEIPFNRLVKFEYNTRGEISKLLEY
jgi:hypothetical protein